jgi:hypothetical protein
MLCASFAPNIRKIWVASFREALRLFLKPLAPRDGIGEIPSPGQRQPNGLPYVERPQSLDWLDTGEYIIRIVRGPSKLSCISTTCELDFSSAG